jgi:hypothetical protein
LLNGYKIFYSVRPIKNVTFFFEKRQEFRHSLSEIERNDYNVRLHHLNRNITLATRKKGPCSCSLKKLSQQRAL